MAPTDVRPAIADTPSTPTPAIMTTAPLPLARTVLADRRAPADDAARWWRVPMVWVVISGPLAVVVASLLTAVIAWRHIDPVILDSSSGRVIGRAGDEVATPADPKAVLAPAQRARNHSATPRE